MPEIAEVARIVHFLRQHLVGKTVAVAKAQHDDNVFGKVGTSAAEFERSVTGKKVVAAGQQGKYFWLIMSTPPHPVFHFGMTGWMHIRGHPTAYYRSSPDERSSDWPPKFWKFTLETKASPGAPAVEAAFTDARRFSRVRLVDCPAENIRKTSPLVENGPDPVIDKHIVTREWLADKCGGKKIPIKALLLDQANISGIGNWVGDEVLFQARIHPEQYSNTLNDRQIYALHHSIHEVIGTAVDKLAESDNFPDDWLFKHRWGKGKKDAANSLPTGERIVFVTVGGRTSAVVPTLQRKTGAVAGGNAKVEDVEGDGDVGEGGKKRKRAGAKGKGGRDNGKVEVEDDEVDEGTKEKENEGGSLARGGRRSLRHAKESITTPAAQSQNKKQPKPTTKSKKSEALQVGKTKKQKTRK